jgi:DNA-binding CsgD family transcriptional regulator
MASQLSPRQREILDLVAEGRTSKEIAVALGISESTVNWHLANAFERLGASSRAEAVALAIRSSGAARATERSAQVHPVPARIAWPRLVAVAIAIAIAGALLGGATVAMLHLGPAPTASPANGSDLMPLATPAIGPERDGAGGDLGPVGGPGVGADPTRAPLLESPATLPPLPAVSAPPVPTITVPLPTPALPSLPVTPPLPSPSVPLPIPTPTLPIP